MCENKERKENSKNKIFIRLVFINSGFKAIGFFKIRMYNKFSILALKISSIEI